MAIEIVPFQPAYATAFKDLNIAWLQKLFTVEPHDEEVLQRCEQNIIAKGGYIFFAKLGDAIVGCFALMKISEGVFELTKMAVAETHRGLKIGQQLLNFCLDFAKEQHFKEVLLYSTKKLENAIYLYRKFGFKEVPLEKDSPYQRADIKMVLKLRTD
jgi:ribosomal protein S18 acetylase RimI-like enzyme